MDKILECYIDGLESKENIIKKGYDPDVVEFVLNAMGKNEYKRRQSAPGLKVTSKAFGVGRRMMIASKWNG